MSERRAGRRDVEDLHGLLRRDEETARWLEHLEAVGALTFEVDLPAADALPPVLIELAVPHEDVGDLVRMLPTRERAPGLWWLLERAVHSLVREMGAVDGMRFPVLPEGLGALRRYFYIYVFVAVLPHVRAYHRARNIPENVSRLTLADLGRNMAVYRRRRGEGGLDVQDWLQLHFRGALYQLGRLQFQRGALGGRTGRAVAAAELPYGTGDPALGVHIPAFYGPLSPEACDASFARAREFFARHFPEERYGVATCHSWMLDEQLAGYLPEDANIVRFQRRFRPAYRPEEDDAGIVRFVFGQDTFAVEELPRRTALERAVVEHLEAGGHWYGGAGWTAL